MKNDEADELMNVNDRFKKYEAIRYQYHSHSGLDPEFNTLSNLLNRYQIRE